MRPITLIMEAFGPFSKQETIHFDTFKDKGIFLITGPTGAGKTTIFDAMIYALYGVSSGDQRDGDSFRSDHARSDQMTSVTLTFMLKGKIYTVRRIPKQMRPKLSGDGLTVQTADAELEGEGIVLSGIKEVTEKINDLFGLNAEQFRQIMMIPQGEFRRLILSDSKEKTEIFRKLFGTALFERIQDQMKLEEDVLKNQHFEISSQIKALAGQLSLTEENVILRDQCIENPVVPHFKKLIEVVNAVFHADEKQCETLKLQIEKDVQLQDQTKLEVAHQRQLKTQLEELEKNKERLARHLEREPEVEANKIRVKSAQRAELVRSEAQNRIEKQEGFNARKRTHEKIVAQFSGQDDLYNLSKEAYEGIPPLKETHDKNQAELMKLKLIREEVQSLNVYQKRLTILQNEIDSFVMEHEQSVKSVEQVKQKNIEVLGKLAVLQESKVKLAALSGQKTSLNHAVSTFNDCMTRERQLKEKDKALDKLNACISVQSDAVASEREVWQQLETQFMKGYSGLLAKSLIDQTPCPVCGSKDHPNPASEGEVISKADLDASRLVLEGQMNQFEKTKAEAESMKSQRDEDQLNLSKLWQQLSVQLSELLDENLVLDQKNAFKSKLSNFKTALSEKENRYKKDMEETSLLLNQQEIQAKNLEVHMNRQKELEKKLSTCYLERESLKTKIEQIVLKVPNQFLEYQTLVAEIKRLEEDIKALSAKIQNISDAYATNRETLNMLSEQKRLASEELDAAEKKLEDAELLFKTALFEHEFDSLETYQEAQMNRIQMEPLLEQVEVFYSQKLDLEKTIKVQNALLKDKPKQDIDKLEEALQSIEFTITSQRQDLNQMLSGISQNRKMISEIEHLLVTLENSDSKYAYVSKLARMARGQNAQRLSFENFVLSQYFEDVLNAANLRLQKMTTGRFELIRKREKSKGNVQSGLDIEVMDQYTGKLRHVKTLSGGETFKASLSLALGLSDIVQRFSGGISLETMFIDEGFGTLDSDSLDKAIESLMSLSNQSRLVGIISHVQELKERIPTQLRVIQQIEGSHTQILA
ncbi:AAA family ATPase [Fusibacter sp. 3D3]|uniref:AAA family ATPase n=1 Tax=Fusibacter sp. 3D3 TaxID=1048380 RepID=UPI00085298BB|nr:SMC family ATPase [Fusibacter sp. 3D3]GAU75814.1 exonuclease SbcC [Fusibacter sp. 3D3]